MPLFGEPFPRPHRRGQGTKDDAMEASAQRVRMTFGDRFPAAETYEWKPPETPLARSSVWAAIGGWSGCVMGGRTIRRWMS